MVPIIINKYALNSAIIRQELRPLTLYRDKFTFNANKREPSIIVN